MSELGHWVECPKIDKIRLCVESPDGDLYSCQGPKPLFFHCKYHDSVEYAIAD